MATQILIRSKDLAHALNLSTLIDGETQILRSRENGIEIFEILDPNALVQLVVGPPKWTSIVLNDKQTSVDETNDPKQTSEEWGLRKSAAEDIVVEPTATQPPNNLALVRATVTAAAFPVGASTEKVAYPRPIKLAGRNDEMKNSPIDAHLKLKSNHPCPERNLQKKSPEEPYPKPKSCAAKINKLLKQHARPAAPNLHETKWNTRYHELVKFKRQFGNCIVPRKYDEAPYLYKWVETQRLFFRKGIMKEDRLKKLNDLGFCWNVNESAPILESKWNTRYHELVKYKHQSGNCIVPKNYVEAPNLHDWVKKQRLYFQKGILKEDRLKKLKDLGFCWNVKELAWNTRYIELILFRQANGHTRVPQKYDPNPSLGLWVIRQRNFFRTGALKADRVAKLNEIGFSWDGWVDGEKNYDSVLESDNCGDDVVENTNAED